MASNKLTPILISLEVLNKTTAFLFKYTQAENVLSLIETLHFRPPSRNTMLNQINSTSSSMQKIRKHDLLKKLLLCYCHIIYFILHYILLHCTQFCDVRLKSDQIHSSNTWSSSFCWHWPDINTAYRISAISVIFMFRITDDGMLPKKTQNFSL